MQSVGLDKGEVHKKGKGVGEDKGVGAKAGAWGRGI